MIFLEYPKCSSCKRAKAWLNEHGITYVDRHIADDKPTEAELKVWHELSGLPLKRFFNTSGLLYKELNLKEKLAEMSDEEKYALLATNGMLVKRPLIIDEKQVLVGFKEAEWTQVLLKSRS